MKPLTLAERAGRGSFRCEDVLYLVAHDLRSPLATIVMTSELLADEHVSQERKAAAIEIVRRAAAQMEHLIADILETARLEGGGLRLATRSVSANALLLDAWADLKPSADSRGVRLELAADSELGVVHVDPDRIEEVFTNLVGNALKFTAPEGLVTIRGIGAREEIRIEIEDTGCGIAAADLPHIFDRFWQAQHAHRAGAGLGLAIARGIVQAHGGRIWVTSTPGKGTTFYFTVPRVL